MNGIVFGRGELKQKNEPFVINTARRIHCLVSRKKKEGKEMESKLGG